MAVLVECTTVIVRNSTVELRYPGGLKSYVGTCPNQTYCTDGVISRVSFMVPSDARDYAQGLVERGFLGPTPDGFQEVALVDPQEGCLQPCAWLEADLHEIVTADGEKFGVTIAFLHGEEPETFVAPAGWRPGSIERVSVEEIETNYEFQKFRDRVETYRHKETGKLLHVARPDLSRSPDWKKRSSSLFDELKELERQDDRLESSTSRRRAIACYEEAERLVQETGSREVGPLVLLGMWSRMLGRWETAQSTFLQVTEAWPDFVGAWLELTWAQISLDRLEEAEISARRAVALDGNRPDTLGNLASVLLHRGELDAALRTVRRALDLDPDDLVNFDILAEIRRRQPWYKKLTRCWHRD